MANWWLHLIMVGVSTWWRPVNSEFQPIMVLCSSNEANTRFQENRNTTFSDLRTGVSEGQLKSNTANVETIENPVYSMVQCRKFKSDNDCLSCFEDAVAMILKYCPNTAGGRIISDSCFLRYERYNFYNKLHCASSSVHRRVSIVFRKEGVKFLNDLQHATPYMNHYNAVSKRMIKNTDNLTIYGVAQCVKTISPVACQGCISTAYETIRDCLPATDARHIFENCSMRYSNTPFFNDSDITDISPFIPSDNTGAIIYGVVGAAGFAIIIVSVTLWFIFSRKLKIATRGNILEATELQRTNRYSYRELKAATNNFSVKKCVGRGGFSSVYKAILSNGVVLAVKKLYMSCHSRVMADFETEVRLISNVHHCNLLRLLGCCSEGPELLLVYEYMENGSLDRFLYGEKHGSLIWKQRLDIIFGIAEGILYLHEHYRVPIIHRDIKPSNILLDSLFQPKIADFGLVKLLPENQTHMSTKFAGTLGYTAPEYARSGQLSKKVDVYSFGIVILEIISGRKCIDVNENSDAPYLLEEARSLFESDEHHKLADEKLKLESESLEYEAGDLKKMVEIALLCTQTISSRPTMSEIVVLISSDRSVVERLAQRRLRPIGYAGRYHLIPDGSNASLF